MGDLASRRCGSFCGDQLRDDEARAKAALRIQDRKPLCLSAHLTSSSTQHYSCVEVIPPFQTDGNLPAGVHEASWSEFATRYGINPHRARLADGLQRALTALRQAGCTDVFVDGSYATAKPLPRGYDVAWSMAGVNLVLLKSLEPLLFDFASGRAAQKSKFLGELFPAEMQEGISGRTFLNFFQTDRDTGQPKGIVRIDLRTLP